MQNIILKREGEFAWISWIKKRIKNNLNFLAGFFGPTGSGKTWTTLSVAYMLDPEFDPREQLSFNFSGLMNSINKCNDKESFLGKKKYKVLIFDEAQTSVNKRDWQSRINKLFLYLLSTFRHQNIIILFNSPYSDFLDSATTKLMHAKFELKGWSRKTKEAHVNPKLLQYNGNLKKFYEHRLYVMHKGERGAKKLTYWMVPSPPEHIVAPYEDMKTAFTSKLNEQITRELKALAQQEEASLIDTPTKELNPESMQPDVWEEAGLGYRTQEELRQRMTERLGKMVSFSLLNRNIQSMRKKGWDIRKYKIHS
ncbi:ATP-binding protein [archaeon]|nr:ATP-binding protein [archaeon]